jgi:signal peptidase complex subunit 3
MRQSLTYGSKRSSVYILWRIQKAGVTTRCILFCVGPSERFRSRGLGWQAYLAFSLNADLSSSFSWNTKLLFVYLVAEYKTPYNTLNQACLAPQ